MLINFVYIKRDSPVHRLDPRVKFVLLFAYSLSAAQTSNFWFILAGFIGALIYYSQARSEMGRDETSLVFYFLHHVHSDFRKLFYLWWSYSARR